MVTYRKDYLDEKSLLDYAYKNKKNIILKKALNSGNNNTSISENLKFCSDHPAVSSIIVGTINPDHLLSNIEALEKT